MRGIGDGERSRLGGPALLALTILVLASGCGVAEPVEYRTADILEGPPVSVVGGVEWSAVDATFRARGDELSVSLGPSATASCRAEAATAVTFRVPRMEGEYPLRLDFGAFSERRTVTFVTAGAKIVAAEGLIVVDSLDEELATFGIVASADDRNRVNGWFTAASCADEED